MPVFVAGASLGNRDNPDLVRLLTDHAGDTLAGLEDMGVVFYGPLPNPAHGIDRLHGVLPNSAAYIHHLSRAARKAGARLATATRAIRLIQEGGAVVGVELDGAVSGQVRVNRGVVLASGDFSADRDLRAAYGDPDLAPVEALVPANTGDGHKMALPLGAHILNGDLASGPVLRFVPPPLNLLSRLPPLQPIARGMLWALGHLPPRILRPFLLSFLTTTLGPDKSLFQRGAILVNRQGDRFVDELDRPELAIAGQPGKDAYIVFDDELAAAFATWPNFVSTAPGVGYAYMPDYRRNRRDIYRLGDTPAALARALGMPAERLAATVQGRSDGVPHRRPLHGRLHALGPVRSYMLVMDGGVAVTHRLEVTTTDGTVIPGLFAAGGMGQGGALLSGLGNHIGWAMTSGRLAGEFAAHRAVHVGRPDAHG